MSIWRYCPGLTPHPRLAKLLASEYCIDHFPRNSRAAGFVRRQDLEARIASLRVPCRYCQNTLRVHFAHGPDMMMSLENFRHLFACDRCGWWFLVNTKGDSSWNVKLCPDDSKVARDLMPMSENCFDVRPIGIVEAKLASFGNELDHLPIDEIRRYLLAKEDARFSLNPHRLEEVVGAVYKDFGYHVVVTGSSGDGGIDVVLADSSGIQVGVQVKRYKNRIKVALLRELLGALVLNGMTRGVFVTTSGFQRGADKFSKECQGAGYHIDLIDGDQFLSALGVHRRLPFASIEQFETEFSAVKTHAIGYAVDALLGA